MLWMIRKREVWLAVLLSLSASFCVSRSEAQQQGHLAPRQQGRYYQSPPVVVQDPPVVVQPAPRVYIPPPTFVPTPGVWVPIRRPTDIGQFIFGPVWTFYPTPPQEQPSVPPPMQ